MVLATFQVRKKQVKKFNCLEHMEPTAGGLDKLLESGGFKETDSEGKNKRVK